MQTNRQLVRLVRLCVLAVTAIAVIPLTAAAQGSIFGTVQNADLTVPPNGNISFFGFLDDTDEEIRIETSTGAGYDDGNWFDDFQNYLTEAPGNPYDYYFYNASRAEGFHLNKTIPNNSFQQENILLQTVSWPGQPSGLTTTTISSSAVVVSWDHVPGQTMHVYRRLGTSTGSFFRIDNTAGQLSDPGVVDSFFVDATVDGASSYQYVVIAEDGSGNYSPHSAIVTANSSSSVAPVLVDITPTTGLALGGTDVTITGSGFDPAGVSVVVGSAALTDVTVVSPYEITGTTQAATAGTADVTVTNSASGLASNTLADAYTYEANTPPVLAAIGSQSVVEGQPLNFTASASDADGGFPVMTSSALPGSATYIDNNDGTADFAWTPGFTEAGTYNVIFYATDPVAPSLVDSEQVVITVTEAGNQSPVLAAIGAQTTTENVNLNFAVSSSDPDETTPTVSAENLPTGATFTPDGSGGGTFDWTPDFTQAGNYNVTFIATDGAASDSEVVAITVNDAGNQTPNLAAIGAQGTTEGTLLTFGVSASDPDGTNPALSASPLPGTAIFTDNGDGTGTFDWTPDFDDAGSYDVIFVASDGTAADSETVTITVADAGNQAPELAAIGNQTTDENVNLTFGVSASDLDGTIPALSTTLLPGSATFLDNGDGTGTFDWTPTFADSGTYAVTFYASDGVAVDSEQVTISVNNVNQLPVLAAIGDQAVLEGNVLNFGVSATDGDTEIPVLSTSTLPGAATFTDNGDGTGTFDWATTVADSGIYAVTFYATDPAFPAAVDSEVVSITVTNQNLPPILTTIGDQTSDEAVPLNIPVSATDGDGDTPILSASALPTGATFVDNGDGTGAFDWTPTYTDAGVYQVTFYATDGAVPTAVDSEVVTITINDVNEPPVLTAIGPQSTSEGLPLSFGVIASDGDGDTPLLSTTALPAGATFVDNGDGTGLFDWTPTFAQDGSYDVTFYAIDALDAGVADSEVVTITVLDAGNQPPVLDSIGDKSIAEGTLLAFTVTAGDADGTVPTLSTSALPTGAVFTDSTGEFAWTPDFTQAGSYDVTFFATDGAATDSEVVTISVTESGNQPPVIDSLGTLAVTEGNTLEVTITATDPEGSAVTISINTTLQNYTFVDNGDGTALLTYTPNFFDAGVDSLIIFARDDGTPQVTQTLRTAVVTNENNQAPVIEPVGPFTVEVNGLLEFTIEASDTTDQNPFNILFLSVVSLPPNATFTDNGNGTGSFRFTPQAGQEGSLGVQFLVVDEGTPQLSSQITVDIEVLAANQAPILAPIGPQVLTEGETVTLNLAATDPDGTTPFFDVTKLPRGAEFTDNSDGTAVFTWTPDFIQSGLHSVTFKALDGLASDKEVVLFQVADAGDQVPVFDTLPNPVVVEGTTVADTIYASDPDTLPVTIGVIEGTEPPEFTFTDNGDGTAEITMSPDFTMAGVYIVEVWVSDGTLADTTDMIVTYDEAGNQPPVINPRADTSITELKSLQFTMTATDVDGDIPQMTAGNLPLGADYTDLDDGSGFFNWVPNDTQAGVWNITFYAEDTAGVANGGVLDIDSTIVQITVIDTNRAPFVIEGTFSQQDTVAEGDTLVFVMRGIDPDSTVPSLTAVLQGTDSLADNMTFVDSGNGFGYLTFIPSYTQGAAPTPRRYNIDFQAVDELDPTLVSPVNSQLIRVFDVPQPPTIRVSEGTGPFTLDEGESWFSTVYIWDVDARPDSARLVNPPTNATLSFVALLGDSLVYNMSFSPNFAQAGTYSLTIEAFDPTFRISTEVVEFTVVDAGNQAPTIVNDPPLNKGAYLGLDNEVVIQAEDREGDSIMYSTSALAPNMSIVDDGNGTATLMFAPDSVQLGNSYDVTVTASDGVDSTVLIISYQVGVFMRGDSDDDEVYTLNDVIIIAKHLYRGGGLPDPWERCDVDRSGIVDPADLAYLVNYLYNYGPRPPQ